VNVKVLPVVCVLVFGCREALVGHRLEPGPLMTKPALSACVAGTDTFCGVESNAILADSRHGFTSFYASGSVLPLDKHPRTPVRYDRYWWSDLEPSPGAVQFELIDASIRQAAAEGQRFAFRVMPEEGGTRRVPEWLEGGSWGARSGGPRSFSPDYDSPQFLEAVERTVTALGARYDGDGLIDHVDVGFVGDSGEWAYATAGTAMPSAASRARILQAFSKAFKRTPVLMQIGGVEDEGVPLKEALALGFGWRADCWGDLRQGWNHHDDFYEQQLEKAGAFDAWKQAPVAVETCGDMSGWGALGYDVAQVRWLLKWALEHHVSFINNKSRQVPAAYRPSVDEYLSLSGTRPYVHQVVRSANRIEVAVHNRGSAPPYRAWKVAMRVRGHAPVSEQLGVFIDQAAIGFPKPLGGPIDLAVLDEDGRPVPLANEGVQGDGWLELFP
jgi:hypothetical protein